MMMALRMMMMKQETVENQMMEGFHLMIVAGCWLCLGLM